MKFYHSFKFMGLLGWSLLMTSPGILIAQIPNAATLQSLEGTVQVIPQGQKESRLAQEGQLLYVGDTVQTKKDGKASILLRDGSEIRLFEQSTFAVDRVEEQKTEKRTFYYDLVLKAGSLWGRFLRGRQQTTISSATATIGVKGTAFRFQDDGKSAEIALTEGSLKVNNDVSSVNLVAGKRLSSFKKEDSLKQKMGDIPYRLSLQVDQRQIDFSGQSEATVYLSIQMVEPTSHKNIKRGGKLYLKSNFSNVVFPKDISLNPSGFVRIPVIIRPPRLDQKDFDGNIEIFAMIDSANAMDVGDGMVLLTVVQKNEPRHIQIDVH